MNVICIDAHHEGIAYSLTLGHIYKVTKRYNQLDTGTLFYQLRDNRNVICEFFAWRFVSLRNVLDRRLP